MIRAVRVGRGGVGDTVVTRGPCPQIDLLASLRTEGTPDALGYPSDRFAAPWAIHDRWFDHVHHSVYRLQKVSSNCTVRSTTFGRVMVSGSMKRMFSAYLLALISGITGSLGASRMRSICALRPLMVN